ncbi:hypothetical protein [Thermomonospora cellulosilytica]|uniref:FXSXX-COOH protein n=1 Tax=Thermomonospora cellulosilytica TaxID=1411118 RepID=A0A7W3R935_9ACTN|nr:hypothetical protein [Thermomonospora cellulosilytica]MBA9004381.1 hypothetical protein [Thermomonospora cellulosilytica]
MTNPAATPLPILADARELSLGDLDQLPELATLTEVLRDILTTSAHYTGATFDSGLTD